jgi:amino acid transporter
MHGSSSPSNSPTLERGLGPWQATALNIANMIGIGPFITIPAFIATMQGPQAMIGWVAAAVLVLCDGLVWSELGAAMPGSGGTYHFLREIFGRYRWGRIMPFLFIWQFLVSGALEMASGYVGVLQYLEYAVPGLAEFAKQYSIPGGTKWIAAASVLLVTVLLCRRITSIGWMGLVLCAGTIITVALVILAGLTHFNPGLLRPPPGAFVLDQKFATGLGGAMLIAIYDYLGYYNICHLGDEVRQPERTIPRAVITSVIVVALIYLTMNVSIIAVVPWQEAMNSKNIAALFMERLYGRPTAVVFTGFVLWTSIACMFAATLGYSRIPYAAARRGDFFPVFAYLHPTGHYPLVSLLAFGVLTAAFCFLDLGTIISAAVCVRIGVQFIGQIIGLHLLRTTRPDVKLPFRMWFYPLPSLIALGGWLYVLATADRFVLLISVLVLVAGVCVFVVWTIFARQHPGSEAE